MAPKKTRKVKQTSKPLTIPQLRKSFDHIDAWVESHVKKGKVKDLVPAFQAEWKRTFHRDVDAKAAEAYLSLKATTAPRITRKQRGGTQELTGAPLDYTTRQGVYGVYGNFPAYVSTGLNFYNDINLDSLTADCGKENITPKVPVDIGSNKVQAGGKTRTVRRKRISRTRRMRGGANPVTSALDTARTTLETIADRPFPASSPPTAPYVAQMDFKGVNAGVPAPADTQYSVQPYDPVLLRTSPGLVQANLPYQLRGNL